MQVASGTRLGPYEIVSPLGAGGMGEVWRAKDTRLDRSVAIKILPAELAQNAQFKMRFEREAKAISQLNHPHICTLYDVGDSYLVMELLEGESLADRIAHGPMPMSEVLKYGVQIAAALDKAHRAGITHRDLKPGNIMITKSGAKLLDFGLARVSSRAAETARDLGAGNDADRRDSSPSPGLGMTGSPGLGMTGSAGLGMTEHKPLTEEGTIIGTFQYMAPEQLEGEEADARTDIFALGALLYEMATGKRAFVGKSKTSLIAAIVSAQPAPISQIQPLTPPAFEHVVAKCLEKDRDDRWQSAHDVAEELRWISASGAEQPRARRAALWKLVSAVLAVALLAAIAAAALALRQRTAEAPLALSITPPPHAPFEWMNQAALSPDGSTLVFVARSQKSGPSLWVRALNTREHRPLARTEGALVPFWSPDGRNIGFFAEGKLKRIAVSGGPPQIICDAPVGFGGTWNRNGVIVFASDAVGPLYRVDATGGKPRPVTKLEPREEAHRWPFFLPDGQHFVFLGDAARTEDHWIRAGSLRDGSTRDIVQAVTNATYAEPGYLLFIRAGSLLAQPFDLKRLALAGEPRVVAEQVVENESNHHDEFSASSNGRLLYRSASSDSQLAWVDRKGRPLQTMGEPQRIGTFAIAPDQQRIAVAHEDADGRGEDVWLLDLVRGISTRATLDPAADFAPVWSPDGSKIAFSSMRTELGDVYIADAANAANVQRLTTGSDTMFPTSWSPDGQLILFTRLKKNDVDIWLYSLVSRQARAHIATPFDEELAVFAPDGASIAYVSNESGRDQVYVERFPSHAGRRQISTAGGSYPVWRRDGRELFYVGPGLMLMSVDMTTVSSPPQPLFQLAQVDYDVAADGQRFLVKQPVDDIRRTPLTFLTSWAAESAR